MWYLYHLEQTQYKDAVIPYADLDVYAFKRFQGFEYRYYGYVDRDFVPTSASPRTVAKCTAMHVERVLEPDYAPTPGEGARAPRNPGSSDARASGTNFDARAPETPVFPDDRASGNFGARAPATRPPAPIVRSASRSRVP